MKNKVNIFIILVIFLSFSVFADGGDIALLLTPGGAYPLGESASAFKLGGGAGLSAEFTLPGLSFLSLKADIGYSYIPLITKDAVSLFSTMVGLEVNIFPFKSLKFSPYGAAGYYYGSLTDGSGKGGGNISIKGGFSAYYYLASSLSIGLDFYYLNNLYLYSGIGASLGAAYHIQIKQNTGRRNVLPSKPEPLKASPTKQANKGLITSVKLNPVFPVLFKHYNSFPVGSAVLHNKEKSDISDISVSFFVERYMDNPKECGKIKALSPGKDKTIDLYALFSDSVLEITEGTKVSAKISYSYTFKGKSYTGEYTDALDIYDRNATTWDDNRKAAAFVTAKDPSVLEFSKRVTGWVKATASRSVNKNLSTAMGLHEALRLYGITYVVDPKTPYTEFSKNKLSVDFLQFPRQTLTYTAGDCDDLSILYSALLESVGVETAFITIPGHIYMAFSLNMEPGKARRSFLRPDELIYRGGKTWLPLEITMTKESFLKAWEEGAKEWRENKARNQAELYPLHDCWKEYKPVGLPGVKADFSLPSRLEVVNAFQGEVIKYIDREIYPKVSKLQGLIRKNNNNPKYLNRLGVLYARYGLMDKAVIQFNKILEKQDYVPTLINMGNIKYLNKEMEGALKYYNRAASKSPDNPKVLLCIARTNHELENYGTVKSSYDKLKAVDPALAEQFSYLALRGEEASRAEDISAVKGVMVWDEE